MTIWSNTAEGTASGTTATAAATASGGDAFDVSSGSPIFSNIVAKRGVNSYRFSGAVTQLLRKNFPSGTTVSRMQGWFQLKSVPSGEIVIWQPRSTADAVQGALRIDTARKLLYRDASSAQTDIYAQLALDAWYRIAIRHTTGAGTGVFDYELYDSANALLTSGSATARNHLADGCIRHQIGKVSGTATGDLHWDDVSFSDTGGSMLTTLAASAPVITTSAPTTAEPLATITVTATATSGTPDAWTWTQLSGPTVTLTGTGASRSFVAPAIMPPASNVVIQASATQSGSTPGLAQSTISILPCTDWSRVPGGGWRGAPLKVLP